MNPIDYELVFDIERSGYQGWWGWAHGLLMIAFGVCVLLNRDRLARSRHPRFALAFSVGWLILAVLFTIVGNGVNYSQYARLRDARAAHTYSVVEGRVEDLEAMPHGGHMESFVVGDTRFRCAEYETASSFHDTTSQGSPIREGLQVRIGHVGGEIVTLEIARGHHPASARRRPDDKPR